MASFFGTSRQDTFVGLSTENNLFSFRPGVLQAFDSIVGGTGSFLDTIAFTASARVQAGKFDVVRNIEVVRLDVPGIELTVSRQLVESSQLGYLIVQGSIGSDIVSGQPTNPGRAPVTGSIHFNGNGGADTFNGGEGDDLVTLNRADLGTSTLNGHLGFDTLDIRGAGLISAASLANVSSFETFRLNGAQELFISQALFDTGLGVVFGDAGNQVVRADAVTTGGHNLYFNAGGGSDQFFGGAEISIWSSQASEIDSTDFFDGGVGGDGDFLQIFGDNQSVSAEALGSFLNIDGFQVFGNNTSVTLNANQASTADGYISALYQYGTGSTIDASAVSGDQFVIDVFLGQSNTYIGTQGADIIVLNAFNGNFVNGFAGLDQVQLNDLSSPDLTDLGAVVDSVESLYLQPSTPDVLFLDPSDIPDITGGGPLIIGRDPNNLDVNTSIESNAQWSVVATGLSQFDVEQLAGYEGVWFLGNSFTQYTADGETVFVEESITAFGNGVAPSIQVTTLGDEGYDGGTLADELADGGGLSLREAIGLASNDYTTFDRITFHSDLSGGTITLDAFNNFAPELTLSGLLEIDGDIDGDGVSDITIDGDGQTRIFRIQNPGDGLQTTVTLNGLALTNGFASNDRGGAVLVDSGADATIRNSAIFGNAADDAGGGVAVDFATLTIENSEIFENSASDGGGVYAVDSQTVIRDSSIISNSSGFGGGIYATGFGDTFNSLEIVNTQIETNAASNDGGGLYIDSSAVDADLVNVTFALNSAGGFGGGIALLQAAIDATNLTVANNIATLGGGISIDGQEGGTRLSQATITGNYAESAGGGIHLANVDGEALLNNSIITGNAGSDPGTPDDIAGTVQLGGNFILGDQLVADGVASTVALADIFEVVSQNGYGVLSGELADNGGHVWTVALLDGGVAQDAGSFLVEPADSFDLDNDGNTDETVPYDARGEGFIRVIGGGIDLGAFESGIPPSDGGAIAPAAAFSDAALPRADLATLLVAAFADAPEALSSAAFAQAEPQFDLAIPSTVSSMHGDLFAPQIA